MDFRLTQEQELLQKTARDFAKGECPSDLVRQMEASERGYTDELWRKMAELGWQGLMLPQEYDGTALGPTELAVIHEELGKGCVPGPLLSTALGAQAIVAAGSEVLKGELLPRVAAGALVMTLAYQELDGSRYEPSYVSTKARAVDDGFELCGSKCFVPDALAADYIVVTARTSGESLSKDGISLFLVPRASEGLTLTTLTTTAGDRLYQVNFSALRLGHQMLLGELHHGWPILARLHQLGAVAKCAEMVGGAQRVLDMTVAYALEREQFGQAIGRFQAVQHHLANMAMDVHGSRYITYKAAWMLGEGLACDLVLASAKGWTSEAYKRVCALGHQIGAATAYIVEHDMTLYSRRAKAAELAFGDAGYHRGLVAQAMGL